jgi:DNA modification methylase
MSEGRQLESWPVERLRPYERNPRTHSPSQIQKIVQSLDEFGWTNPILADADGTVIAGHGRLEAAKAMGRAEVPVIVLTGLTDAQRRAYVIADNRLALEAGWDSVLLAGELEVLRIEDFDLGLLGFDPAEIAKLLAPPHSDVDAEPRIDEADALREKWATAPGQLWRLGAHRLLCGDSTNPADVARLMAGQLADCLWTDPPWNVNYGADDNGGKYRSRTIANDHLPADAWAGFVAGFTAQFKMATKPGAPAYVVMSAQEWPVVDAALRDAGFHWSSTLIWVKDQLVLSRKDYHTRYEPIWYGWNAAGPRLVRLEDRKQDDVWEFARPKVSELHPTTKPVGLVRRALENSTLPKGVVLDLFGGSGSTLVACEQVGRQARLMELDPRFAAVILQRFVDATGVQPELEPGGAEDAA